jgi:hypothetical protein
MKYSKNKTKSTLITMILILATLSSALIFMPVVNAHDPPWTNVPTYAYVTISPGTVGLGQYVVIVMWVNTLPPTATGFGGDLWRNYMLNVTKPDGKNEILGPFTSNQIGNQYTVYTPDQVGKYTVVFSWPGQILSNGPQISGNTYQNNLKTEYVNDTFLGATSEPVQFTVQQEPITSWQEPPLPEDYWTFPINVENRQWAYLVSNYLAGSWLRYAHWQEYGQAPNSAHILWTKPLYQYGGIADANYGAVKMGPVDYETFMDSNFPIIMAGRAYYNAYTYPWYGYYCVDLRTGELQYFKNGTDNGLNNPTTFATGYNAGAQTQVKLSFGQLFNYYGINGAGVEPYLWMTQSGTPQTATSGGTMWHMIDANTGNWVLSLKNVPSGTAVTDEQGDLLLYSYNANTGNFLCWNSTQSIRPQAPTGTGQQQWKPQTGTVIDAVNDTIWTQAGPSNAANSAPVYNIDILPRSGYTMNVTNPTWAGLTGYTMAILQDAKKTPKEIVFYNFPGTTLYPDIASTVNYFKMAVFKITKTGSYNPPTAYSFSQANNLGFGLELLWNKTIPYPVLTGNYTFAPGGSSKQYMIDYDNQVFCLWNKETQQYYGYSLTDGSYLWGPTARTNAMDYYAFGGYQNDVPASFAYGILYNAGYGGDLIAYNITTGEQLWTYNATNIGYESPYGSNYPLLTAMIADGKLYEVSGEHSASQPMWRGAHIRCINATTGVEIWKLGFFVLGNNDRFLSIGSGEILGGNQYDDSLYAIGKGPSATTVSAPQNNIGLGQSVTLTGTVLDQSAGTKSANSKALYPNGVPCVSDASQEGLMEYLYEDQAYPTNLTGVRISLDAIDPNGNFVHIGDTASDAFGNYGLLYIPEVPGTYQIIARFTGSNSYGSSSASAFMSVSEASATPIPTATPLTLEAINTSVMTYIIFAAIAIIIAIAIATLLMLRKRP